MKRILIATMIGLIMFSGIAAADITVQNFEVVASKAVYKVGEPVDALIFASTDEYLSYIDFGIYDIFSVSISRLTENGGTLVATKGMSADSFKQPIFWNRSLVNYVPDIADGATLPPGTYVMQFFASYHHGGTPFKLITNFVVEGRHHHKRIAEATPANGG